MWIASLFVHCLVRTTRATWTLCSMFDICLACARCLAFVALFESILLQPKSTWWQQFSPANELNKLKVEEDRIWTPIHWTISDKTNETQRLFSWRLGGFCSHLQRIPWRILHFGFEAFELRGCITWEQKLRHLSLKVATFEMTCYNTTEERVFRKGWDIVTFEL